MTSKERVLTAIARQAPDRVPIDYSGNPGIDGRLKAHFSLRPDDDEGLLKALNVDFRFVNSPYAGPKLHPDIPSQGIKVDDWGKHRRWVPHESGGYWQPCGFPLEHADAETVASWPMPSPDDFDYSNIYSRCCELDDYCLAAGGCRFPDIINGAGHTRGMEQALVDLITDDPAGLLLIDRRTEIFYQVLARTLEAGKGKFDLVWMGEDLGTQIGPMVSLELFRKHIRPRHQRFIDLAKSFNLPVLIHCCGSSSWAFGDFIEMGINVVDTLQPEARDMAPSYLKKTFGKSLAFHGCISTAGPLATGTVDDTIKYVRRMLDIMMPGGGYCLSPTHMIQDNSPTENVLAMYETALKYGRY